MQQHDDLNFQFPANPQAANYFVGFEYDGRTQTGCVDYANQFNMILKDNSKSDKPLS